MASLLPEAANFDDAPSNNNEETIPELVRVNQNYMIDGHEVLDSSALINHSREPILKLSSVTSTSEEWNMVSKNLSSGQTNYFYFDADHYSFRQFAFDNEESESSLRSLTSSSISSSSISGNTSEYATPKQYVTTDGVTCLYTDGYSPSGDSDSSVPNTIQARGIIGTDDRVLVGDTTVNPYKRAGLLIARFEVTNIKTGKVDSLYYSSTGFMMGPDLLVTAGHAVYGDVTTGTYYDDGIFNPTFPDDVYYYPAKNGDVNPYGIAVVERVYLEKSYYQNTEKDWAACKLKTKVGNTTGWCGKISYFHEQNYPFDTYGYPSSGNRRMYRATARMTYFESAENGYYYRTDLDSDGGQSGSPYIVNLDSGDYVCGIHTYSANYVDTGVTAYTGGIRIDALMFSFLNSFVASESLYNIRKTDYGFADSYPVDYTTKNQYYIHELDNGLTFRTRRYRTGYIHDEYIVMSPIRDNIPETKAFIEYSFKRPIEKIEVELSRWRSASAEILNASNGKAALQIPGASTWETKLDLLASATALPTDRNMPKKYVIEFDTPIYSFRFYSEYNGTNVVAGANRGRICIGDMSVQFQKCNYQPLNWSELDYRPDLWSDEVEANNNCYAYAINNQVHPGTNSLWKKQQPGEYAGNQFTEFTGDSLIEATSSDFKAYTSFKGQKYVFESIGKNDACPPGTYKVALAYFSKGFWIFKTNDYHWYRQDADGYWSHKPGTTAVRREDNSGKLITDPETCNRGNYNKFVGFFAVTPWSNLYAN